jgi:hypothetical protein
MLHLPQGYLYREYNNSQLYIQLLYFQHLFQVQKELNKNPQLKDSLEQQP